MRVGPVLTLILAGASGLLAEDFWTTKDPSQWSAGQIRRIVTDSPWAKEANVSLQGSLGLPPQSLGSPAARTPDADESRPARAPTRAIDSASEFSPVRSGVVVRWESATPVREACDRGGMDRSLFSCTSKILSLSDLERKFLELAKEFYIISMSNYPNRSMGGRTADQPQHSPDATAALEQFSRRIQQTAMLKRARLVPLRPSNVVTFPAGRVLLVVLFFPRAAAISPSDKEVWFESADEILEVKARFDLRKMVYKGRLDL